MEKSPCFLTVLVISILASYLSLLFFVMPFVDKHGYWQYTLAFLLTVKFILLSITVCIDPGFMKNSEAVPFLELVKKFEPSNLCPACEILTTEDSRHCLVCNRCVERLDHHCTWINTCIGLRNHGYFFGWAILFSAYLCTLIPFCFLHLSHAGLDPRANPLFFSIATIFNLSLALLFLPFVTFVVYL